MKKDALIELCRSLPHVTEDIKWDNDLVFSIGGKMFACFDLNSDKKVSFKTSPAMFSLLTAKENIVPAPYLARHDWVLIQNLKALSPGMFKELLHESYQLVAAKLPQRVRKEMGVANSGQRITTPSKKTSGKNAPIPRK
ncbi:MAG: MmcQ/YjbR family DNA-binding protein [bacterium]